MEINFNTCSLISFHANNFSLHFGVYRAKESLYKYKESLGHYTVEINGYKWGRYIEPCALFLEYFGCGPLFMICWW